MRSIIMIQEIHAALFSKKITSIALIVKFLYAFILNTTKSKLQFFLVQLLTIVVVLIVSVKIVIVHPIHFKIIS